MGLFKVEQKENNKDKQIEQQLLSSLQEKYKDKPLRVLELFAGIGACSKALERLGINHQIVDAVEIDSYAVKSFNAVHNTDFEPQDITKWDKKIDVDLLMHGSPCTDFSIAGQQMGGDEGSGTRSSLMYETLRIVKSIKPKMVVWENVKNVLSDKHNRNFFKYIETMRELGYNSYYNVLNAKDYGIPQNRQRIFVVSINKDFSLEKYEFPKEQKLKLRLKDMLEENVDESYYLSNKMINFFKSNEIKQKEKGNGFRFDVTDGDVVAKTVTTRAGCRMDDNFIKCVQVGNLEGGKWDKMNESSRRVYSDEGLCPTIHTCQGGNTEPKVCTTERSNIEIIDKDKIRYKGTEVELPAGCASRGRNLDNPSDRSVGQKLEQTIEVNTNNTSNCLTTFEKDNYVLESAKSYDEKDIDNPLKGKSGQSWRFEQNVYSEESKCVRALKSSEGSGKIPKVIENVDNHMDQIAKEINKNAKHQQDLVQTENGIARTLVAGTHLNADTYTKTIVSERDAKEELCDKILEQNLVEPYDVIQHNYTNSREENLEKDKDSVVVGKNILPTLTTRPDTLGVTIPTELQNENVGPEIKVIGNYSPSKHDASRIVDKNGVAPTVKENHGTVTAILENESEKLQDRKAPIMKVDIPQMVEVRKFPVDNEKLAEVLREQKKLTKLTSKEIADKLNVSITKVEHWFRTDDSFAIPEPELWNNLKQILNMEDNTEFDESIMTFEEQESVYEKSNRCYHKDGISPTLTAASADEKVITDLRIRKLTPKECWRLMGFDDEDYEKASLVNSKSQLYKQAGNSIVVNVLYEIFKKLL